MLRSDRLLLFIKKHPAGLMLLVLLLAAWLRLWRLDELPSGLWFDEAYNMMDALWMLETASPQLFMAANSGREPMLHYLGGLFMMLFGVRPYAFRLVAMMAGLLAVPLIYRWLVVIFATRPDRHWVGLFASAGLATSFWHVMMSRIGLRAILFPLLTLLTVYFFWQIWRGGRWWPVVGAGLALGLSQDTYLSARLLPLLFVLFPLLWLVAARFWPAEPGPFSARFWLNLGAMALLSAMVFLPLGLFFWNHPETFGGRMNDMSIVGRLQRGEAVDLPGHLLRSLRVFVGGYHPSWRLDVVGRPSFDWLQTTGFLIGLAVALRYVYRPPYLFLLLGLVVLWLPAALSIDPIHSLRMAGMLAFYYALMGVGLSSVAYFSAGRLGQKHQAGRWSAPALLALLVLISGGRTAYDYFVRWPAEPDVYWRYDGPLIDLIEAVVARTGQSDVLLPFPVYAHPTSRVYLRDAFREVTAPPDVDLDGPITLVTVPDVEALSETKFLVNQNEIELDASYVWLSKKGEGPGIAFVSRPVINLHALVLPTAGQTLRNPRTGASVAQFTTLPSIDPFLPYLTDLEQFTQVDYNFGDQIRLTGYQVRPKLSRPGQTPQFHLAWQSLTGQPIEQIPFIQLLDGRGQPVSQLEGDAIPDKLLRWRRSGLARTQYPLWLRADIPPGPYLIRMGLFNPEDGVRLPIYNGLGQPVGDQLVLGMFYVGHTDPRQPETLLKARLGETIDLLGYSLVREDGRLSAGLVWQARSEMTIDYTAFVQVLDAQNQIVAGWDAQPLAGQYPTSDWQPGEFIADRFTLSLPPDLPAGQYRLVTGMYDLTTGQRLPAFDDDGQPLPDALVQLTDIRLP